MRESGRDLQGILGGSALIVGSLLFGMGALQYNLGTAFRMGPGFFPLALSILLGLCGLAIILISLQTAGRSVEIAWRPLISTLASVVVFGLLIDSAGMIPATFAAVPIAALGDRNSRPLPTLLLALGVTVGAVLIFHYGIRMTVPLVRWPL